VLKQLNSKLIVVMHDADAKSKNEVKEKTMLAVKNNPHID
jgi:hypothetical protein